MNSDQVNVAAQQIVDAVLKQEDHEPVADNLQTLPLTDAYRIQHEVYKRLGTQGGFGPLGGHKIALTSQAVQSLCGVSQPLYGSIFQSQIYATPAHVSSANYGRLGLEFEVAVKIGAAVPVLDVPGGYDAQSIAPYVDVCMPAFELIDDRNADYERLDAVSILTDRCWCAGVVLGNPTSDWQTLNLADSTVELYVDNVIQDRAIAGDSMGHPFNGLAWVANFLLEMGQTLQVGDIVMTGSALKTLFPKVGQAYTYRIDGLGEVSLTID